MGASEVLGSPVGKILLLFFSFPALVQSVQSMTLSITPAQTAAWRKQIFEQLSERTKREMDNFRHYEQAVEQVCDVIYQSSVAYSFILGISIYIPVCLSPLPDLPPLQSVWIKKGTMQWWKDWKPHKWINVNFALEQFSGPEGNKDGILFVYYNFYEEKKVRVFAEARACVFLNSLSLPFTFYRTSTFTLSSMRSPFWFQCLVVISNTPLPSTPLSGPNRGGQSDWRQPRSWRCMIGYVRGGLYPSSKGKRLQCSSSFFISLPVNFKLALLSVSCCDSRGIQGPPSKQAIWSITCKGDIFVSEPSPALEAVPYPTPCDQM